MTCLKNYIGIKGCAAPEYNYTVDEVAASPSGLYINGDLPITLKQIDKIANEEQVTFLGVWDQVQERAIKKFALRVKAGYRELYGACSGIDDDWLCTNSDYLAMPLLYFLGSELMYERIYSERINLYTTIDKNKAVELRADFDEEFKLQLKSAFEGINDGADQEAGDIFSYVEGLP